MTGTSGVEDWERAGPARGVVALGTARVPIGAMPAFRKAFCPPEGPRVAPALVKHADDQTVLGLAAVLRAIAGARLALPSLVNWGVIAAPRFLGRQHFATAASKFQQKGPSSVSPLIIPNYSLHSMSGTISLAIGSHGTNFGVGGGHGQLGEVLLAGLVTLQDRSLPGLWIVATQWDPEPIPDPEGKTTTPAIGHALAMGLVADAGAGCLGTLRLSRLEGAGDGGLVELVSDLEGVREVTARRPWRYHLPGLGVIELTLGVAAASGLVARAG